MWQYFAHVCMQIYEVRTVNQTQEHWNTGFCFFVFALKFPKKYCNTVSHIGRETPKFPQKTVWT